jgi:hypothetical protein
MNKRKKVLQKHHIIKEIRAFDCIFSFYIESKLIMRFKKPNIYIVIRETMFYATNTTENEYIGGHINNREEQTSYTRIVTGRVFFLPVPV